MGTAQPPRAALYARISDDDSGGAEGVGRQLEAGRAEAARRGWQVAGEYVDNDVSAYNGATRAEYRRLLADATAGTFDHVVVFHTSRLWRDRRERAAGIEQLQAARVGIAQSKGPDLDLATAQGRQLVDLLGAFDTAESAIKSERVAAAAEQKAYKGEAFGRCPYGWQRVYHGRGPAGGYHDEEDPHAAAVVRELTEALLQGYSLNGLAQRLNGRGEPTPTGRAMWAPGTVRALVRRPGNAGLRERKGEIIGEAAAPALVPLEQWQRVRALLARNAHQRASEAPRPGARRAHLLTWGVGYCGLCGSQLRGQVRRARRADGSVREHEQYSCAARGCVSRDRSKADDHVGRVVCEYLARPSCRPALATSEAAIDEAEGCAAELRARLQRAGEAYEDGVIDRATMRARRDELEPQLQAADAEVQRLRAGPDLADVDGQLVGPSAAQRWAQLDVVQQRRALEVLGVRVVVWPQRSHTGPRFDPDAVVVTAPGL